MCYVTQCIFNQYVNEFVCGKIVQINVKSLNFEKLNSKLNVTNEYTMKNHKNINIFGT